MKKTTLVFLSIFFTISLTGNASANLINGGFETTTPVGDGWNTGGNVFFSPFTVTLMPTEGTRFVQLNNGWPGGGDDFNGPSASDIDTALNVNFNSLIGVAEGSYIYQDFSVTAGSSISFDYLFLTNELENSLTNDMGIVSLSYLPFTGSVSPVASTYSALVNSTVGGYDLMTGVQTYTFDVLASGTARLGFAILDVGDAEVQSSLYLDNVSVASAPVPEPATILLFGAGLAGLIGFKRRREK